MKKMLYKLVDFCCLHTTWLIICSSVLFICPPMGFNYLGHQSYLKGAICLLLGFAAVIITQLINNNSEKVIKNKDLEIDHLNKENKKLEQQGEFYKGNYFSLLRLMDTFFDDQMLLLHDSIAPLIKTYIRTSIYIYNEPSDEFYCLARYSAHPTYCQKNKQEKYPNKGWLQSTWNEKKYTFYSNYSNLDEWIKACQKECEKNCLVKDTCESSCIRGKKEHLPKGKCAMLSKKELTRKRMRAKSVFGYVLQQGINSLGIILVEGMEPWSADVWEKMEQIVPQHSSSPLGILSAHGKQLLELLNTTDMQKDMAEGFQIGERRYAK